MQRRSYFKLFVLTMLLLALLTSGPFTLAALPDAYGFAADDEGTPAAHPALGAAQSGDVWRGYTNGTRVRDVAVEGNTLWAATEGGVVRWDMASGNYVQYTTADGLAGNDVLAVAVDAAGHKWFGTNGGVSEFFTLYPYEIYLPLALRNH